MDNRILLCNVRKISRSNWMLFVNISLCLPLHIRTVEDNAMITSLTQQTCKNYTINKQEKSLRPLKEAAGNSGVLQRHREVMQGEN